MISWIVLLMAGSVEQELYKDTKVEQLTKRKLSRLAERLYIRTHLGDVAFRSCGTRASVIQI